MPADDWVRETYENHRGLLFRVAWLILRRADLAEDAVHTAFSRIVSNRPQLNGNAKGYVLQAVRNAAIDMRRKLARRRTETVESLESVAGDDEVSHHKSEQLDDIAAALAQLDEAIQEIIYLHIHERMTFREIGELIGAPLPTVASRYRRGLEQIRSEVNHDDRLD